MKRVWIACALLLAVLAGTLGHSRYIQSFTDDLIALLAESEVRAESGDWTGAEELTKKARDKWEARDVYLHITLRHDETDVVYTDLREVQEFLQCEESGEYSAANARLIANLELIAEAEQLTLKNIL